MNNQSFDLKDYMAGAIGRIVAKAYAEVLHNPQQAKVAARLQRTARQSVARRREVLEERGVEVPPFLIASIATTCNLNCKGCYARQNGIASERPTRATLCPAQWRAIMDEAASLGVNFVLLAGGEPMTRRDILEAVAPVTDLVFPIFTNGTFIAGSYVDFLKQHPNMVPVVSIEGTGEETDARRGAGVYKRALTAMQTLKENRLFFGNSITVTSENIGLVTSDEFVGQLHALGCKMIIYVEYVPTEAGTEHLALDAGATARMEAVQEHQRTRWKDMIIISFPGDEEHMGGCLAAGRGFFHIGPDGAAEPCPFSPYSDSNVATLGVEGALKSPLFRRLRDVHLVGGEHTGGCALYEHRDEVEALLQQEQ